MRSRFGRRYFFEPRKNELRAVSRHLFETFAVTARDLMAMPEHLTQLDIDRPPQAGGDDGSAVQFVLDAVSKARPIAEIFELMTVQPLLKGAGELLVDKQAVLDVFTVQGNPLDGANLQYDPGTGRDAASLAD